MPARLALALLAAAGVGGCTSPVPGQFRLAQLEETFDNLDVNTKLDILWVIDNSGSMAAEQDKLRLGFQTFASRYMKPTWDIRLAVVTTDTYLGHPAFANYLNGAVSGTSNHASNYVNGITMGSVPGRTNPTDNPNPVWAPTLFSWSSNKWRLGAGGATLRQMRPNYGTSWAKLLAVDPATGHGNHDGPPTVLCIEPGATQAQGALNPGRCHVRDDVSRVTPPANSGPARCAAPGAGEDAESQCINTALNDSAHSGYSIISTLDVPEATLIERFLVNATVGILGQGIETGILSVLQLLRDNEAAGSTTAFFRPKSLRVIIFVSDEEDNSFVLPEGGAQATPWQYLASGSPTCTKTIDGLTYTISRCLNPALVYPATGAGIPIAQVKSQLDQFFRDLDQSPSGDPGYFIATITALTAATIQTSGDQATRDLQLGQAVGNGSLALEIESADYTPLLDAIGQVIVQKKGVFQLSRAPAPGEQVIVKILHANGSFEFLPATAYTVQGAVLTITDQDVVLGLRSDDLISIFYQPSTVF